MIIGSYACLDAAAQSEQHTCTAKLCKMASKRQSLKGLVAHLGNTGHAISNRVAEHMPQRCCHDFETDSDGQEG